MKSENENTLKAKLLHKIELGEAPNAVAIVTGKHITEFYLGATDVKKIARGVYFASTYEVCDFAIVNNVAIAIVDGEKCANSTQKQKKVA